MAGVIVHGRTGRNYRLLPHERRGIRRRRLFFRRLPSSADPSAPGTMLQMAALANVRIFITADLTLFAFAMVMYRLTVSNGGPLAKSGSPLTPTQVIVIIAFWGLVLLGVAALALGTVRFTQSSRENKLTVTP